MLQEKENLTRRELLRYVPAVILGVAGTGIVYGSDRARVHFRREAERIKTRSSLVGGPKIGDVNWFEIYAGLAQLSGTVGRWGQGLGGLSAFYEFFEFLGESSAKQEEPKERASDETAAHA